MYGDYFLVAGVISLALAIPSGLKAFSQTHSPRGAIILGILGVLLIGAAVMTKPSGYTIHDVPAAFTRVIGMVVN